MAVPKHLEDAAARMKEAEARIEQARTKPLTLQSQREWLAALTDHCVALAEIQAYNSESVHEKLHELAARTGVRKFPWRGAKGQG